MQITRNDSPNRSVGRQGHLPDFIVCHITEGAFNGTVSWITNPSSQVSYNFVVARDGRIVQAVGIENTAWANGTTNDGGSRDNRHSTIAEVRERRVNANLYSVSIGFEGRHAETRGALTDIQLSAGAELIRHIRNEIVMIYGVQADMLIVGHHEITPRTRPHCPGEQFPFEEMRLRAKECGGEKRHGEGEKEAAPTAPPPSQQSPSEWAREAWAWATAKGVTDGARPRDGITREEAVTMLHRYHRSNAR